MAIVLPARLGHFTARVLKTYSTLVNQTDIVLQGLHGRKEFTCLQAGW